MNEIKVEVVDNSFKDKMKGVWSKTKTWASNRANEAMRWTEDHWHDILKATPIVLSTVAAGIKVAKMIKGSAAEQHEARMSKCYYDPSTGLHWQLKRDMTNDERIELVQRKREGEYTEDILQDMKILKK